MQLIHPDKPFYKGNLHMHTTRSDGVLSPEAAIQRYHQMGYDFIAITDHRVRTCDTHWHENMLVLSGIELDFMLANQVVHLIGVGVSASVLPGGKSPLGPQSGVNHINVSGGVAILAHPAWSLNTPETIMSLHGLAAAEVYNAVSAPPFSGDRADSTSLLDVAAANGRLLNTVAADDSHHYRGEEGRGFIRVQADALSEAAILSAIRDGRFHASCGPAIHSLRFEDGMVTVTCSPVEHIVFLSNLPWTPRRNVTGDGITQGSYAVKQDVGFPERWVRVVLIDKQGRKAWSNPIPVLS